MADAGAIEGLTGLSASPTVVRSFSYDQVYRLLRRALLTRQIVPGTRLVEVEVAARLGVSRTPVREALRRLESDGVVVRRRGGGLEAAAMTASEVRDLFLVRGALDRLAARLASERASKSDWDLVRSAVAAMGAAIAEHGQASEEFHDHHLSVHAAIYELAFGPRLSAVMRSSVLHSVEMAADLSYSVPHTTSPALAQHEQLVAELACGDPQRAEAAADAHVRRSEQDATRAWR